MFSDLRLESPWFLLLLLPLPLLLLLRGRKGRGAAVAFSSSVQIIKELAGPRRALPGGPSAWLLIAALTAGILALARPQKVRSYETVKASGVEIAIAIDVSLSMAIEDFTLGGRRANRLAAAKKVTRDFVDGRPTDRIGLVAFAGRPYIPSPLTLDHEWLRGGIDRLRLGLVEDGTAVGSAIAAAARRLDGRESKSKIIVLLTDGANNSGDLAPRDAAKLARTLGIRIYTIAVGTPGRHPIPVPDGSGRIIASIRQEFDVETLQDIADIGKGAFFRAQDTSSLEKIFEKIDELEKTELERQQVVEAKDLFPWFVGTALAAGCLFLVVGETFTKRFP